MEDQKLDILFKLPQITTRSQLKLNSEKIKKFLTLPEQVDSCENTKCGAKSKKNSRKTNRCLSTKNVTTLSPHSLKKKKGASKSVCSDSDYGTSSSYTKDEGSVGSRESGFSDFVHSLEEDSGEVSRQQSPPDLLVLRESLPKLPENSKVVHIKVGNFMALIPSNNLSKRKGPFSLSVENDEMLVSSLIKGQTHHIGSVVSLKPHGVEFYSKEPAILVMPLKFEPRNEAWITVFYSNTSPSSEPHWQRMPKSAFHVRDRSVIIYLERLTLITVVEEEPFPEILKKIRCRTGGRLRIREVPGIEVNFPRGCLDYDIDAFLRVLFDSEPLENTDELILASPIICLGPPKLHFNENNQPVLITLPIPEYEKIMRISPSARLVAYQSSQVSEDERMVWQRVPHELNVIKGSSYRHGISGIHIPSVTFPVHHFSFFKVVWELLSSTLYEAKMGMSYFYPYISFSMMCQAFMEESHENNRFGLEVICYRSDRKLPETTNYRHRVGASLKPKLVRPGKIAVRLRSQMFEADIEAGEDADMVKEEPDFRGRDFEKQYACKFKPDSCVERGPFGKVIVERLSTRPDPLFEFNLHKTGVEATDNSPAVGCERWTVFAMKELASSLQITEGNHWKTFAKHIGFTKSEIKNKLSYCPDPFLAMMNTYNSRGGTPEEFVQALYVVSRDIRLGITNGNTSPSSGSSRSSRSNESGSFGSGSQESSPMKRLWGYRPWAQLRRGSDSAGSSRDRDGPGGSNHGKRRQSNDKSSGEGGSAAKKRRISEPSPEPQSSASEDDYEDKKTVSTEKHKNCSRKLNDKDLWRISSGIVRKDWRNLGRTLGIEENILSNLEHSHQSVGFRECAYQMLLEWKGRKPRKCTFGELYSALVHEKMNSVAKLMIRKIPSDGKEGSSSD